MESTARVSGVCAAVVTDVAATRATAVRVNLENRMRWLYTRIAESEPLHATVEIGAVGTQSARRVGDVPFGVAQRAHDQPALIVIERLRGRRVSRRKRARLRAVRMRQHGGQVRARELLSR